MTETNTQRKGCITTSLFSFYFSTIKIANISLLIREMMTHSPTKNTPKRETPEPPLRCRHIGPEVQRTLCCFVVVVHIDRSKSESRHYSDSHLQMQSLNQKAAAIVYTHGERKKRLGGTCNNFSVKTHTQARTVTQFNFSTRQLSRQRREKKSMASFTPFSRQTFLCESNVILVFNNESRKLFVSKLAYQKHVDKPFMKASLNVRKLLLFSLKCSITHTMLTIL